MTSRRVALAVLVLVAILAGLAGFSLREPPASADSIERIPACLSSTNDREDWGYWG